MKKIMLLAGLAMLYGLLPNTSFAASVFAQKLERYQDVYVPTKLSHAGNGHLQAAYGKQHAYGRAYKRRKYVKRRGYRKARRYYGRAKQYYHGRLIGRGASSGWRRGYYDTTPAVLKLTF